MRRVWFTSAALLLALGSVLAQSRAQIFVTIVSNNNSPVSGMAAAEVELRDGGVKEQVLAIEPATEPLAVAVVLSGVSGGAGTDVARALDSLAAAMRTGPAPTRVVLIADGPTSAARMVAEPFDPSAAAATNTSAYTLPDQVTAAAGWLATVDEERRAIVAVVRHGAAPAPWPDDATSAVIDARASLWTIELDKPNVALGRALDDVTARTGALRLAPGSAAQIVDEARHAAALLNSQYLVTFEWPDPSLTVFNITTRHDIGAVLAPIWFR